jgi:hypothetical protein
MAPKTHFFTTYFWQLLLKVRAQLRKDPTARNIKSGANFYKFSSFKLGRNCLLSIWKSSCISFARKYLHSLYEKPAGTFSRFKIMGLWGPFDLTRPLYDSIGTLPYMVVVWQSSMMEWTNLGLSRLRLNLEIRLSFFHFVHGPDELDLK